MQLPMLQGQGQGQPQPQGQPSPQQPQQKGSFPSDAVEAKKFSNDILQVLYDDKTHGNIVNQLSGLEGDSVIQGVGMTAANIVGNRVSDVRAQTGRQIEMKLVVGALKDAVIPELAQIATKNGFFEMSDKDKAQATQIGISILDDMGKGKQQQGQQPLPQGGQ